MDENKPASFSERCGLAFPLLLILLPVVVFYAILIVQAFSIPMGDDIAALDFGIHYIAAHSLTEKLALILFSQHNEYKLILVNATFAADLSLFHRLDFIALCHIGNLFMLPVFAAIAFSWNQASVPLHTRLLRLVPASLLLFQLQYWETLDWVMSGLQDLPILAFAIFAIALCTRQFRGSAALASVCIVLGICTSGNGFCVMPICAWMLFSQRRIRDLLLLTATTALTIAIYAYHYVTNSQQAGLPTRSILHKLAYFLTFNGAIAGIPWTWLPGVLCGSLFVALFFVAFKRGYQRQNPAIFYSMVFILFTALLTTAGRSNFPLVQAWSFRYRVYATLWLIFIYIFLSDELTRTGSRYLRRLFPTAIAFSLLFCLSGDMLGVYYLRQRRINTTNAMLQWEREQCGLPPLQIKIRNFYLPPEGDAMLPAIRAGIYNPPILDRCYRPDKP